VRLEPFGETAVEEARAAFARQARGLVAGGVDGFILETFGDLIEIRAALEGVRRVSDLPIVAQMTVGQDGVTAYGTTPAVFGAANVVATMSLNDRDCRGASVNVVVGALAGHEVPDAARKQR